MNLQFPPEHPAIIAKTQVALPNGSFIRALPFAVDEIQRFRIDALVLCADIVASAYIQMIELALRSNWEESQDEAARSVHLDIGMFQHAWSMVDQIYSLRLLLRSLDFTGDDVDTFMSVTEPAYVLRNRMDHLDQRIPNIVASKDNSRSLFGSLSYFVLGVVVGSSDADLFAVTHYAEPIRPNERIGAFRMPAEIRGPIGNFVLNAAGQALDLDAVALTLGPVMVRTNERFEKSIRAQTAQAAAEHGVPESDLLAHQGARLKLMMALNVRNADQSADEVAPGEGEGAPATAPS